MDQLQELLRRTGLDLTGFSNFISRLWLAAIVRDGRRISVTVAAGATAATARHGLGRTYQAGLVETVSASLTGLRVLPPGGDSATLITVAVDVAPVAPVTVSIWAY